MSVAMAEDVGPVAEGQPFDRSGGVSPSDRDRGRKAMRELLTTLGVEYELEDLTMSVAVAVVPDEHPRADERMDGVAKIATVAVLDALVYAARLVGWRP